MDYHEIALWTMWQLESRCLTTDNTIEMPIHNVLIHDQFKPAPIFIRKFKHYTLLEPIIVIYELNNVLLAHERVYLGHPQFVLMEQEGRGPMLAKFSIHPAASQEVLNVMLQVLVQSLPERYWTPVGGCSYDSQMAPCIQVWHLLFLHKHVHLSQI
jgi:hypothetical protein